MFLRPRHVLIGLALASVAAVLVGMFSIQITDQNQKGHAMTFTVSAPTSSRRRGPLLGALAAVLLLITAAVVWWGAHSGGNGSAQQTPPGSSQQPWQGLRWDTFTDGSRLPISPQHGPRTRRDGLASGYSHTEPGAVLAAIHLSTRTASAAGPEVYRPTVQQQTYGEKQAMLQRLAREHSNASMAETSTSRWWYSLEAGDPRGDLVRITLAADTAQARQHGGYAQISCTLSWRDGDWRLQVPTSSAQLVNNLDGYTPIPLAES